MKMKYILKCFFSFFCTILSFFVSAQENKSDKKTTEVKAVIKKTDSLSPIKKDRYGLRVGVDLFKLTRGFYDKNYQGLELVGDYRLTKKYFLAAEIGTEKKTTLDDRLNSTATGTYLKAGFDYNAYNNWLDMENIISIGLRGGFSRFNQELNSYKIYNPNPYWGELPWQTSDAEYNGLTAGWLEVVAGLKVKVYNNIFVGFSLRMNMLLFDKSPGENFENLYIPGFNRTYDGSFGVGLNYTVSYFIPLYKKTVQPKGE